MASKNTSFKPRLNRSNHKMSLDVNVRTDNERASQMTENNESKVNFKGRTFVCVFVFDYIRKNVLRVLDWTPYID